MTLSPLTAQELGYQYSGRPRGVGAMQDYRPALPRNDSYAFDAENERLDVVAAAHGRVQILVSPAEVRDVHASYGVTGQWFGTVYALRVPLTMPRMQSLH